MLYTLNLTKFETTDHLFLPALLYQPLEKTDEVAIFLHGNGHASGIASVDKNNVLGEMFARQHIAYFPFNNRGAHYINKLKWYVNGEKKEFKCGTAYELIKDCIYDIDGAIQYLEVLGYKKFILVGASTGSNKAVVYNYYKKINKINRFILLEGGDDTGLYYQQMGEEVFKKALQRCTNEIKNGNRTEFADKSLVSNIISYQALYDTINPEGDYNIFPYYEYFNHLNLAKKELFREFSSIKKPTLVVYGSNDQYCSGPPENCLAVLKEKCSSPELFTFKIIPGAEHGFGGKETELAHAIEKWIVMKSNVH